MSKREFLEFRAALDRALTREQRRATPQEWRELLSLREAAQREHELDLAARIPGYFPSPPPSVGILAVEYGPLTEPAAEEQEPASGVPGRDPIPVALVTDVVRFRIAEHKPWAAIEKELAKRLSCRKIHYIRVALKHHDLSWDRGAIALGPVTRNTPAGIVLPVR